MPKLDVKRLQQYLTMFIGDKKQEKEFVDQYEAFYKSVLDLANIYGDYLLSSAKYGMKTIGMPELQTLRHAYERIISCANSFKEVAADSESKDLPELKSRIAAIDSFCDYIRSDMFSLSNVSEVSGKSLIDIFDDARAYTIDISGQNLSKAGANMSSRIPVSFVDKGGKELKGFFTPETKASQDTETRNMFAKAKEGHPEYDLALRNIIYDFRFEGHTDDIVSVMTNVKKYLKGDDILDVYKNIAKEILEDPYVNKGGLSDPEYKDYIDKLADDKEFSMRVLNLLNDYGQIKNKYRVLDTIGIEDNSIIEQRNAAMSVMGDLIGMPDLLARSVQMSILQNGVKTKGVFMEFANGSDIFHIKENDPLKDVTYEQLDNPTLLKQLADLQILDYVCGNTDRHLGNMFYKFEETENGRIVSGITGIDNDNSFGKKEMSQTAGVMQLPGVKSLMVINEGTAARIKGLSHSMIKVALQNYSLSAAELDAAWARITTLQQKIIEGEVYYRQNPDAEIEPPYIKTVSDEDWKKITLKDLSIRKQREGVPAGQYKNYFTNVSTLPAVVADNIARKQEDDAVQRIIETKHPELKKQPGSGFKMAKGEVLLETNAAGILDNNRRLTCLESTMYAVNRGAFISSTEFNNVMKSFKAVKKLSFAMTEGASNVYLEKLNDAYKTLGKNLKVYLDKKSKERNDRIKNNKKISLVFENRVEFAEELQTFVNQRVDRIENELARTADAENFVSESMSAKFSNYVRNRIVRQNDSMLSEVSSLPHDDAYANIKARYVNSRTVLTDFLLDATIVKNDIDSMLKENIGNVMLNQIVESYRMQNGAGNKYEKKMGKLNSGDYRKLALAITELPSVDKELKNLSKQAIKEFLLDEKAVSVLAKVPVNERKQFDKRMDEIINPKKTVETQKQFVK